MEGVSVTLGIITIALAILVLCGVVTGTVLAIWVLVGVTVNFLISIFGGFDGTT